MSTAVGNGGVRLAVRQGGRDTNLDAKSPSYIEERRERKVTGEWLDDRPGNGSGSYSDATKEPELWTDLYVEDCTLEPATTFYERDVDDSGVLHSERGRVSYDQLWQHHCGHNDNDKAITDEMYNERKRVKRRLSLLDALNSNVGLTEYQKRRAAEWILAVNLSDGGSLGELEIVIAAISLSANLDERWIQSEESFGEIISLIGASSHHSARDHLQDKFDITS